MRKHGESRRLPASRIDFLHQGPMSSTVPEQNT